MQSDFEEKKQYGFPTLRRSYKRLLSLITQKIRFFSNFQENLKGTNPVQSPFFSVEANEHITVQKLYRFLVIRRSLPPPSSGYSEGTAVKTLKVSFVFSEFAHIFYLFLYLI